MVGVYLSSSHSFQEWAFLSPTFCKQEEKTVNCLFDERAEEYELTKVYVVEFGCELVFSKTDNTFLVND
ncbi:hypothetical protein AMR41_19935 [Hapalosiphon sp. MRB220]|nr:hypothetical protein AMR41_19935 [Hapalosiphon sp. MRB220]